MKTIYDMVEIHSESLVVPDQYQRNLNTDRVASIVAEFDERIANEPKVSLRDGTYYIFDGQHTVMARKQINGNKDLPILCKVYHGMTEEEEARLFAKQTGKSAPLTPSAKLRANLHGNDTDALAFVAATEKAGLNIGFERAEGDGRITCINTAFAEFKRVGADIYTEALSVMKSAWNGNPESLRADLICGVVKFVELYHGTYNKSRLIKRLSETNPTVLYVSGMADKSFKGKKKYVNLIYRIYNGTSKKGRSPGEVLNGERFFMQNSQRVEIFFMCPLSSRQRKKQKNLQIRKNCFVLPLLRSRGRIFVKRLWRSRTHMGTYFRAAFGIFPCYKNGCSYQLRSLKFLLK